MKKILYCKYNQSRAIPYRIKTVVYEQQGKRYVEKIPLSAEAAPHIQRFWQSFEQLKGQYVNVNYLPAEKTKQGLRYPFVEGKTLDLCLKPYLHQAERLFEQLGDLIRSIYQTVPGCGCVFERSKTYTEWFGETDCTGELCLMPANLDLTFSNMIQAQDGTFLAFDYEWIMSVPIPQDFIVFRALHHFYIQYAAILAKTYTLEAFMQQCGIAPEQCHKYEQMEKNMYQKICTGAEAAFSDTFQVPRTSFTTVLYEKQLLKETTDLLHHTQQEYLSAIGRWEQKEEAYASKVQELTLSNETYARQMQELALSNESYVRQIQELALANESYASKVQELVTKAQLLDSQLAMVYQSSSWRMTRPVRLAKRAVICAGENGIGYTVRYAAQRIRRKLRKQPAQVEKTGFPQEAHIVSEAELQKQRTQHFAVEPKISIVTPLFNTPIDYLEQMIESVLCQTYENWELCLYDCSDPGNEKTRKLCRRYRKHEKRVLYARGENRGISENTNRCIEMSGGDYIGILDHDDCLHPSALYEVVKAINETHSDFIYSDEIKFDTVLSQSFAPNFKPDFAADELRAHNFICHFNVYSRSLYEKAGGYRKEFDGSQDHDLVLRLTEQAEQIVHIPKILYYWRVHKDSVAMNIQAKSYATDAGIRAVEAQLTRMGQAVKVRSVRNQIPCYRMSFCEHSKAKPTVVIWDAKQAKQVQKCICSVLDSEAYPARFVILPSAFAFPAFEDGYQKLVEEYGCIIMQRSGYTQAELWNQAMEQYVDQYALFIHASLQVGTKDIYQEMLVYLTQKEVACVDARLINGSTLLSGGMVLGSGIKGTPRKWKCRGCGTPAASDGYEDYLIHARNVQTVSGFCTGFSKAVWELLHGFSDEDTFCLAYGLAAGENGYRNVWTPYVAADGDLLDQIREMQEKNMPPYGLRDPYYNHNIEHYGLEPQTLR